MHTSYLSFFLHRQNFWRIKFTPKKCANYDRIHSKLPIFRVKSVKIYTGQKNLHWRRQRQLSGMQVNSANLLFEFWSLFFLLSSVKEIKDCNNCGKYSIVHSKDRPLCKWPFVKERRNKFCEEQLSRGTIVTWNNCPECVARDIEGHWYMMVLG